MNSIALNHSVCFNILTGSGAVSGEREGERERERERNKYMHIYVIRKM